MKTAEIFKIAERIAGRLTIGDAWTINVGPTLTENEYGVFRGPSTMPEYACIQLPRDAAGTAERECEDIAEAIREILLAGG